MVTVCLWVMMYPLLYLEKFEEYQLYVSPLEHQIYYPNKE